MPNQISPSRPEITGGDKLADPPSNVSRKQTDERDPAILTVKTLKQDRLAEALRANLRRRKTNRRNAEGSNDPSARE